MMKPSAADDVIAAIPEWRGQPVEVVPITGGITNRALLVRVAGRPHFVSIPGERSELLAIPRADEVHNARRAAETGVSPRVLHFLPDSGVVVLEWLAGRTLTIADLHAPGMPARLAAAARTLHSARPFANDFDLFHLTRHYRGHLDHLGIEPPEDFDRYRRALEALEAAARAHPEAARPCSNDLVPENLIDDDGRLWIVDFGYSGNNDPCSELGNAACEAEYDQAEVEALCAAYFGAADTRRLARMHLYAVMSDVAWSLWSVIQQALSDLDFDFQTYGAKRWDRARGRLDADDLRRSMRQA
jgi:thiamine kinase-like enzyme